MAARIHAVKRWRCRHDEPDDEPVDEPDADGDARRARRS
jgi:hypothetical protein